MNDVLQFPTDYPIKIVGRPSDEFRARVHGVMVHHVPTLDPDQVTERPSENGKYLSISYVILAESREQIIALITELKSVEGVMMLI